MYVKLRNVRLHRDLSIQGFKEAFTIYKNVICETSNRSKHLKYKGNVFYQFHIAFAMKVVTTNLTRGLTVDLFIRDGKLYTTVCDDILFMYAYIAVVVYICQICALCMWNQRCVLIMLIIQQVIYVTECNRVSFSRYGIKKQLSPVSRK